jgi:hypothetical protein
VSGATYTLSFWYQQTTKAGPLVVRLSGSGLNAGPIDPSPPGGPGLTTATPGAPNSVSALLPAFPPLWINEYSPRTAQAWSTQQACAHRGLSSTMLPPT